ncbi:hypothetical protein L596_023179 [Steinernema carpocapsae]|uniref:Uncharacterized protein n=1 Tax=Steinernema carpocapsae TaxID=34508 RepID=A0A4U5MCV7_STECR|nr:hypothetical protein L596_023179 [Steinernema carpocapsae]
MTQFVVEVIIYLFFIVVLIILSTVVYSLAACIIARRSVLFRNESGEEFHEETDSEAMSIAKSDPKYSGC